MSYRLLLLSAGYLLICLSCEPAPRPATTNDSQEEALDIAEGPAARAVMEAHLAAVSGKDIKALATTLPPDSTFALILPGEETSYGSGSFLAFHERWFSAGEWSFETKILDFTAGSQLANAVVEVVYREPERDGQPYFNRMVVTYLLRRYEGGWYVVQDHASSIEKSTDL